MDGEVKTWEERLEKHNSTNPVFKKKRGLLWDAPDAMRSEINEWRAKAAFHRQDSLDAERYRAFFSAGLPICFMGEEYRDKESLDAAIDTYLAKEKK